MLVMTNQLFANKVDSLQTDKDVAGFLKWVNADFKNPKYDSIELRSTETLRKDLSCDGIADQWQIKNWEKTDFNGDGLTDLLVTLFWYDYGVYALIDKGNNKFGMITLSYNVYEKCELAKPVKINDQQLLLFYGKKRNGPIAPASKSPSLIDTLIYKYGDFTEFNRKPATYKIDSIEFRTVYCLGSCPVFSIRMDKNGNAVYTAETYNPKQGKFSGVIKKNNLDEITDLINYLDLTKLQDYYSVSWKDDQTCWIRIRFADGTVKEIRDYGMRGTFGLRLLYNKFFELRSNQEWK
jgi:hypothetical protein